MKLKSTLWALAFAVAAVSCSDDLEENGGGTGNGSDIAGTKTYMKVSINPGMITKAGEEGEGEDKSEVGEENEYTVNNVTVILYTDKEGNAPSSFTSDCKLVAAGYASTPGMSTSDETWHDRTTTVEVEVTDASESFDGKTYGVIAVTNIGSDALKNRIGADDIDTGSELANLLQTTPWSESDNAYSNFIMSTHNDKYGSSTKIMDVVTLSANATPENAPEADVHVERLAAKIRLAADEDVTDFIYMIGATDNVTAKVRLDEVKVVNQLSSGTYLLKRVSANVTSADDKTIPAQTSGHDNYLGDEVWTGTGTIAFNYVIDPWTRNKTSEKVSSITTIAGADITTTTGQTTTLKYDNPFAGNSYGEMYNGKDGQAGLTGGVTLSGNTAFNNNAKVLLCYTQENTTSATASLNGYSTGAIFKATYFPKQWSTVTKDGEKDVVKAVDIDYNGTSEGTGFDNIDDETSATDIDFYVYNGNVYKDYEAIFNEFAWNNQKSLEGQTGATIYSYASFNETTITSIKKKDFFNSVLAQNASDPFGYIAYLKKLCDADNDGNVDDTVGDEATFETTNTISAYMATDEGKAAVNNAITFYEDCVCYYPYWIRHAGEQDTNMEPMEFAIVRNNIYDLSVGAINKLGVSGTEKPEPGNENESEELLFRVNILVKNWVVRSNDQITL